MSNYQTLQESLHQTVEELLYNATKYQSNKAQLLQKFYQTLETIENTTNQIDMLPNNNQSGDQTLKNILNQYINTDEFMNSLELESNRPTINDQYGGKPWSGKEILISLLLFPFGLLYVLHKRSKS